MCWQPTDVSGDIRERGRVVTSLYQAVIYDDAAIKAGDIVRVDDIGWLEIQGVKRYLSHRQLIAQTTDRRPSYASD